MEINAMEVMEVVLERMSKRLADLEKEVSILLVENRKLKDIQKQVEKPKKKE